MVLDDNRRTDTDEEQIRAEGPLAGEARVEEVRRLYGLCEMLRHFSFQKINIIPCYYIFRNKVA